MAISEYKITDRDVETGGVVAAPDVLIGNAKQNKMVFDRLIRETVKGLFNGLIDALAAVSGAGEVGAVVEGLTGGSVQEILNSIKLALDSKAPNADVAAALLLKEDRSVTDTHLKDVEFDADTGKFRFIKQSGAHFEIDTVLEKVATNWTYDAATQSLVLELADGGTQRVSLSDLITLTEFVSSDSIEFSMSGRTVTASIRPGSVTDAMLSSTLLTMLQDYVGQAASSAGSAFSAASNASSAANSASMFATAAAESENKSRIYKEGTEYDLQQCVGLVEQAGEFAQQSLLSRNGAMEASVSAEHWAKGTRGGQPVSPGTEGYKDNAKYYAGKAADSEAAAKAAQAAAEKARDEASEIVGGDFVTETTLNEKIGAHNTATDSHADVRLLITELTNRLNALANSDDTTLDQMAEVVAYIKDNRELLEQITTGKVSVSDIVDNLTTNVTNKPLSAAQGVALKTLVDAAVSAANSKATMEQVNAAIAAIPAPDVSGQIAEHDTSRSAHASLFSGKASATKYVITLATSGPESWWDNALSVSVSGVTDDCIVFAAPDSASESVWAACGIKCTAQDGMRKLLSFTCEKTPNADVTVNVVIIK